MLSNFFYPSILGPAHQPRKLCTDPRITAEKLAALRDGLEADSHLLTTVAVLRAKYAVESAAIEANDGDRLLHMFSNLR